MSIQDSLNDYAEFLPYVDVSEGLHRLMQNKKLYAKLLKNYLLTVDIKEICKSVDTNDAESARITIHAFKGVAANLSIIRDFELFKQLEEQIRENTDYTNTFTELKTSAEISRQYITRLINMFETV